MPQTQWLLVQRNLLTEIVLQHELERGCCKIQNGGDEATCVSESIKVYAGFEDEQAKGGQPPSVTAGCW